VLARLDGASNPVEDQHWGWLLLAGVVPSGGATWADPVEPLGHPCGICRIPACPVPTRLALRRELYAGWTRSYWAMVDQGRFVVCLSPR